MKAYHISYAPIFCFFLFLGMAFHGMSQNINVQAIGQFEVTAPLEIGPTNNGMIYFDYNIPVPGAVSFLTVAYRPTGIAWNPTMGDFVIAYNMPLEFMGGPREIGIPFDLDPLNANLGGLPNQVGIGDFSFLVTNNPVADPGPQFPPFQTYNIVPFEYHIENHLSLDGSALDLPAQGHEFIGPIPFLPGTFRVTTIGCDMPNIDLDSIANPGSNAPGAYRGDKNACGPAAAANSFHWLRSHPVIENALNAAFGNGAAAHRAMLEEFSKLMGRGAVGNGVSMENFIKGKLASLTNINCLYV